MAAYASQKLSISTCIFKLLEPVKRIEKRPQVPLRSGLTAGLFEIRFAILSYSTPNSQCWQNIFKSLKSTLQS